MRPIFGIICFDFYSKMIGLGYLISFEEFDRNQYTSVTGYLVVIRWVGLHKHTRGQGRWKGCTIGVAAPCPKFMEGPHAMDINTKWLKNLWVFMLWKITMTFFFYALLKYFNIRAEPKLWMSIKKRSINKGEFFFLLRPGLRKTNLWHCT